MGEDVNVNALSGKTCLITGGAGSIGLATAQLFLENGANVMLGDLDGAEMDRLINKMGSANVAGHATDVTSAQAVSDLVDATVSRWGAIDVVFSNAGNFGQVSPIDEYPEEVFDAVYAVHVKGAFLTCKYAVPKMRDGGSIVITSSVAGTRGDPGVYGYITAKHAQIGLMRCLAKELAPRKIRVNTIHPGAIDNSFQHSVEADLGELIGSDAGAFFDSQTPLGRHGRAEEIAQSVLYLASDQSSYSTGTMLMVDGGMSA